MKNKKGVSRRDFMKMTILAIGNVIGLSLTIPGVAYILGPVLKGKQGEGWIQLGSTTKVETDNPTLFKVNLQRQTGWVTDEEQLAVYVLTENGQDFIAMSNVCTHLGCHVRWVAEQNKFFCPCHDGVFDKYGNVVSGPPPRALDRYEVKTQDAQLYILEV